jgi:hypothetical protein
MREGGPPVGPPPGRGLQRSLGRLWPPVARSRVVLRVVPASAAGKTRGASQPLRQRASTAVGGYMREGGPPVGPPPGSGLQRSLGRCGPLQPPAVARS